MVTMEPPITRVRQRIEEEIRPKLDLRMEDGGYNCCGCSTYDQIVDAIVAILDEETARSSEELT